MMGAKQAKPCGDCDRGYCTMNCGPARWPTTSPRQLEADGPILSVNGIAVAHIDAGLDDATAALWAKRLADRDNAHQALVKALDGLKAQLGRLGNECHNATGPQVAGDVKSIGAEMVRIWAAVDADAALQLARGE